MPPRIADGNIRSLMLPLLFSTQAGATRWGQERSDTTFDCGSRMWRAFMSIILLMATSVGCHHGSELGGKSQGGRRDRNQPYRESPQRECITLDRTQQPVGLSGSYDAAGMMAQLIRRLGGMDEQFPAV
jgi:hypothetical protein